MRRMTYALVLNRKIRFTLFTLFLKSKLRTIYCIVYSTFSNGDVSQVCTTYDIIHASYYNIKTIC